jgi:hypothetical protein
VKVPSSTSRPAAPSWPGAKAIALTQASMYSAVDPASTLVVVHCMTGLRPSGVARRAGSQFPGSTAMASTSTSWSS